ncbi:MAG TPA: ribosome small subunit-dependent GTPase A [Chloroflexus aurantiacus]|jgi:ribosome biogenesis GTPase|uniref:Small ribosomal subunit biogenesis GTPase RsgA n=1 Tax=Chloroflexus aurantiacus (strain ATCC 29366 / DSM 635 / J-10-fl) TaxID=324602 RepID=A9WK24_CHLAA|nr:ribosome small subunit-dependent GTPase A [Chloroflexus aurantiacus]RMG47231.1 MAG: ribosome small subunit-dependent GTPase A [Chloroflexota bacterium]GIV22297.1 MAG: putative ribosome biogenesis GTPase RsgA [Armatimonadota bacterium]GIV94027.1 MAG: putative ribosome biogenesis GTPase RsgA [Chloroflexus sp.]ABY34475.1 ribosome small subunit-dependent GTPase A [Chloroflexus aurantiacus J-10-fl]HBW66582.1 ribosome small subunit-dependent GTPase A [Chloroflexus aurantiacus]
MSRNIAPAVTHTSTTTEKTLRLIGTVLRAQSGFFWVQTEQGVLECRLRGRLKKERQATDLVVIGDQVEVMPVGNGQGAIEAVLPRRSRLARRAAGPRGAYKEDVIVANVDQVLLVFSCTKPEFTPRMLDRYLVICEHSELPVVIVATKIDLVVQHAAEAMFSPYARIGYPVFYTSIVSGEGIAELRSQLAGRISVVTGKSGVGKSSLLNAIQPGLNLRTGEISERLTKGRHTTTVAELIPLDLPGGGYVADTPGIREIGLWNVPERDLAWCFREFRPFLDDCYFAGCTHLHEPHCAVRAAVERGDITAARYDSYARLMESEDEE